jgi:hypothetical protein
MRRLIAVALLLMACKGKGKAPDEVVAEGTPPATAKQPAALDAGAAKAVAPPVEPGLSKEQRKAYRKHLSRGRKLGGEKKWGEAVVELQAALEVIPDDPRASSELGWAAFQAGDYVTARRANSLAARASGDVEVKASALYNLGRLAEATSDRDAAVAYYRDSLALRPSKTVEARLASLGTPLAATNAAAQPLWCSDGMADADAVCACLAKQEFDYLDPDPSRTCELDADVVAPADVAIARVQVAMGEYAFYLLYKGPTGWVTIADLGYLYEGGAMGILAEWDTPKIVDDTKGGHRLLRVTTVERRHDSDMGLDEEEQRDTTTETFCVLGEAPTCPLQVPVHLTYERTRIGNMDDSEIDADAKGLMTPGLPIKDETVLDVTVASDGTATVVLKKGQVDGGMKPLLGPHELW